MNVLLIGGTGVLSSAVAKECLKKGIKVTMINRGHGLIPKQAELIKTDRNNWSYISSMLKGRHFDAVIDFLCYTDKETIDSWNFYKTYTKQYFFISSCAVYDTATLAGKEANEDAPKVLPIWEYSVNKWASEQNLIKLAQSTPNVNYTIIRPCVTYGNTRIPYGISPIYGYHWTLAARILNNKPIIRWNKGVNRCNMMRVEDFAVGVVGLIGNPKSYNQAFNICGDETPSFNDVLNSLSKALHHAVITVDVTSEFYAQELPSRRGEILGGRSIDSINNNKKIKDVVPEFKQTISLDQGIQMTLDAYKSNHYEKGIDWQFDSDTDRIIKKWCKKENIDYRAYNLGFKDYLGNANKKIEIKWWLNYYCPSSLHMLNRSKSIVRYPFHILKKIFRRLFKS